MVLKIEWFQSPEVQMCFEEGHLKSPLIKSSQLELNGDDGLFTSRQSFVSAK